MSPRIGASLCPVCPLNGAAMLVLTRRVGERILVGENITITVVRVSANGVRIGIDAPEGVTVVRKELDAEAPASTPDEEPLARTRPR